jgi:hypothetical protein
VAITVEINIDRPRYLRVSEVDSDTRKTKLGDSDKREVSKPTGGGVTEPKKVVQRAEDT